MNDKNQMEVWLSRAQAMEEAIVEVLEAHAEDAKNQPDVAQKIKEHLAVTKKHAKLVAERIKESGEDVSEFKKMLAQGLGKMKGITMGSEGEKLLKNAIDEYSTEHMEIAVYTAIMSMAQELDDSDTEILCQEIIREEREMAEWLEANLPEMVKAVSEV